MTVAEAANYCAMLTVISRDYPNKLTQGAAEDLKDKIFKGVVNQCTLEEVKEVNK